MSFQAYLAQCQQRVNNVLLRLLPAVSATPHTLHKAMHYAVLNHGKRVRPVLVYATGLLTAGDELVLDHIAASIEFIHSYSLVHDDLPAIDNDDLRRGRPTCHKAFDEATAILVGDALQNLAFQVLTSLESHTLKAEQQLTLIHCLSRACDTQGMVGGQAIDIAATGQQLSLQQLEDMHKRKTGALLKACVELVLVASDLTAQEKANLMTYAEHIGLAFQIQDDILDVEGSTQALGKTAGHDIDLEKATYPAIVGMAQAKQLAKDNIEQALACINGFSEKAAKLRALAHFIIERHH